VAERVPRKPPLGGVEADRLFRVVECAAEVPLRDRLAVSGTDHEVVLAACAVR
jgi:hypothetical protein